MVRRSKGSLRIAGGICGNGGSALLQSMSLCSYLVWPGVWRALGADDAVASVTIDTHYGSTPRCRPFNPNWKNDLCHTRAFYLWARPNGIHTVRYHMHELTGRGNSAEWKRMLGRKPTRSSPNHRRNRMSDRIPAASNRYGMNDEAAGDLRVLKYCSCALYDPCYRRVLSKTSQGLRKIAAQFSEGVLLNE